MNNAFLGEGHVYHSRKQGAGSPFKYPSFFIWFPCADENSVQELLKSKFSFFSLKAKDYLHQNSTSFESGIKNFLKENCNYAAEDVWFHTLPRMFGYAFNPVSFWCCYRSGQLDAVLAEVHNTFGERHFYWINPTGGIDESQWYKTEKVFHVSPFFPVEGFYQFRFQFSRKEARVDINYHAPSGELRLATWISGKLAPLGEKSFFKLFFRYGWITPMVVLRIHFQAFKLWIKKNRFYSKPALPSKEIT